MERKELEQKILDKSLKSGFTQGEIFFRGSENFEVMILEGEVSKYENSKEKGISFRGNYQGKMGYAYTEELEESAIDFLLTEAKENASILYQEEEEEIFAGEEYPQWEKNIYDLDSLLVEKRILLAKRMEKATLEESSEVTSLDYCLLGMEKNEISIINTEGLDISYEKSFATGFVSAIAKRGEETKTATDFWKGQTWEEFNPEALGKWAGKRATSFLGATTIPSGTYDIILEGKAMASLLTSFAGVFYADNCQKGFSLLKGKQGEQIASIMVELRDDPLLINGYASAPFDSEGVAGKNKAVIENGILKTLLYNRKSGKKENIPSTGNGFKDGLKSSVKTGSTNFYIQNGESSIEELMEQMKDGIFITDLMGLHAGTNSISGEFSLSAQGFFVENGKSVYPVEQITVAGNFFQLLKDVKGVAGDLYFSSGGKGSPSVWIENLGVAGA